MNPEKPKGSLSFWEVKILGWGGGGGGWPCTCWLLENIIQYHLCLRKLYYGIDIYHLDEGLALFFLLVFCFSLFLFIKYFLLRILRQFE